MRTLQEEFLAYKNKAEVHAEIVTRFTQYVNETPYLSEHRDYVDNGCLGFGDRSFHWMWKLLVDAMPASFTFLEIGVFCGQVLSLVPYIAKMTGKRCSAAGITMLSTFSGDEGIFPEFPDTDYLRHITEFHKRFEIEQPLLLVGSSVEPRIQASAADDLEPLDILYVDGCHEYEYVRKDLLFYPELVKVGGYLVVDDSGNYLDQPWGFFTGIEPVSRATDEIIGRNPNWKHRLAVMHNRVFQRVA